MRVPCPLHLALALAVCLAAKEALSSPQAHKARNYPLYCAGVVVGMSTDEDVRRMYGDGYFIKDEGHLGGRYYVDSQHRITLHVETGVDRVIESVELTRGVELPKKALKGGDPPAAAISPRLKTDASISFGVRINSAPKEVLDNWGKPDSDGMRGQLRVIRYTADEKTNPYVLIYEGEFHFKRNRLTSVRLYNGE